MEEMELKMPIEGSSVPESVTKMYESAEGDVVYLSETDSDEEGQNIDLSELELREKQEMLRGVRQLGFPDDYDKADAIRKHVIQSVMSGFVKDELVPDPVTAGIREQVERQVSQSLGYYTKIFEFLRICTHRE